MGPLGSAVSLLLATLSCARAQMVIGDDYPGTQLLLTKPVLVQGAQTILSFNEDKTHKLVIDKVEVTFYSPDMTALRIAKGGPGKSYLELRMGSVGPMKKTKKGVKVLPGEPTEVAVSIFGRLTSKKGPKMQSVALQEFQHMIASFASMGISAGASPAIFENEEANVWSLY